MKLGVTEQRKPLSLSCTVSEEGQTVREMVAVGETLDQGPTLFCFQATPWRREGGREQAGRQRGGGARLAGVGRRGGGGGGGGGGGEE